MENYNFQIQDLDKEWLETESKTIAFETRKEAVTFAHNLSYMVNAEIRLSQGDFKLASGTYIKM